MYSGGIEIKKNEIKKINKVSFILATAGIGSRMGIDKPKQFLMYKDKPLFMSSLEVANSSNLIDEIIIVTNEENIDLVESYCEEFKISKLKAVVAGGKERQDSIYNGIKSIDHTDIVIVQDAARPFLKESYIKESLDCLNKYDGIVVGVAVTDTIKYINSEFEIVSTPKRKNLIAVQTPQSFKFDILCQAYKKAEEDNFIGTDDASLVERIGAKIKVIKGDYGNIKVTVKEDLKLIREDK